MRWLTSVPASAWTAVSEIGSEHGDASRNEHERAAALAGIVERHERVVGSADQRAEQLRTGASFSEPTMTPSGSDPA